MSVGASSRSYRFLVDAERDQKAKDLLYNRMANPDILAAKAEEQNNENTVFVGNIPFEAAEADIKDFFSTCGAIVSVIVPKGNTGHLVIDAIFLHRNVRLRLTYINLLLLTYASIVAAV